MVQVHGVGGGWQVRNNSEGSYRKRLDTNKPDRSQFFNESNHTGAQNEMNFE